MRDRPALRSLALASPALAVLAACAWSCGTADVPVFLAPERAEADGGGGAITTPPVDGSLSPGSLADFCDGSGPPLLADTAADGGLVPTCPDLLAQRAFRYALCTCNNYVSDHALFTDAFDGSQGPYDAAAAAAGGSVGVNGDLHPGPGAPMHVGGSLWASNSTVVTTSSVFVAGELHAAAEVRPTADPSVMADALTVGGDAWLAGGLQAMGSVTIGGAVHAPSAAQLEVSAGTFTHGAIDSSAFTVAPACDCAPSDRVDVAGIVATYEAINDDGAAGIMDPGVLGDVQTDTTMPLPCGRLFLTTIAGNHAAIHLSVQGRVALFVKGDISTNDDFIVDVPPGSEFDLFVGGNLTVGGAFMVGDVTNPARARTYVGGDVVNLQSAATLAGNLYAPQATLTLGAAAAATLYGALFVDGLVASADLTIHYDEAISTPSSTRACPAPQVCATSCDCAGMACNSGVCGQCSENTQCCAPLVCGPNKTCVVDVTPR